MPRRVWAVVVGAAVILSLSSACGRKTDVKPPQLVAPEAIKELEATNEPDGIRISWERPNEYVDGTAMWDLAAFRIERSTAGGAFKTLHKIKVTDRDRFRQVRRFRILDTNVEEHETYRYRVVSFTLAGHVSAPSNIVEIERVVPPPPPSSEAP